MNIDQLARDAGLAAQQSVSGVDVEAGLVALHATRRRRVRTRLAGASAAAALVAAVVAVATTSSPEPTTSKAPPASDPSRGASPGAEEESCSSSAVVTCSADGVVRVGGSAVYSFRLPDGFSSQLGSGHTAGSLEAYQEERNTRAGVTVLEDAVGDGSGELPAKALATWVAERPFVESSAVRRVTVGDRPGWQVDVRLSPGLEWSAEEMCNEVTPQCRALLVQGGGVAAWETGPWRGMVSRYFFVDLPHGRPLVLWSWAFHSDADALDANDELVRSFRFH